jgi:hypothetical protein
MRKRWDETIADQERFARTAEPGRIHVGSMCTALRMRAQSRRNDEKKSEGFRQLANALEDAGEKRMTISVSEYENVVRVFYEKERIHSLEASARSLARSLARLNSVLAERRTRLEALRQFPIPAGDVEANYLSVWIVEDEAKAARIQERIEELHNSISELQTKGK